MNPRVQYKLGGHSIVGHVPRYVYFSCVIRHHRIVYCINETILLEKLRGYWLNYENSINFPLQTNCNTQYVTWFYHVWLYSSLAATTPLWSHGASIISSYSYSMTSRQTWKTPTRYGMIYRYVCVIYMLVHSVCMVTLEGY